MYFFLENEQETENLAQCFAKVLTAGMVISLNGDLGMGKTFFVRALLRELGYQGKVKSPTYTLVESYPLSPELTCYHFDCYRFSDPEEWEYAGFRDYFNDHSLCFIEWMSKLAELAPPVDLTLHFSLSEHIPTGREIQLQTHTSLGNTCLAKLDKMNQPK